MDRRQPCDPFGEKRDRALDERERRRLANAAEPADETALDLAAAVAGYGVPAVFKLKRTAGATTAIVTAANSTTRRSVSGRAAAQNGTSSSASGRASTASAAHTADASA